MASDDPIHTQGDMRFFAIGDVHGCSAALRRMDKELAFRASDTVVTLGDYVDYGVDSRGVIEFLLELRTRCKLIPLRGNHELMMLTAREDGSVLPDWLACGGDATMASYKTDSLSDIPESHWEFIDSTLPYHEAKRDFFVHANIYPDLPLAEQLDYMLLWECVHDPAPHISGRRMICGHTQQTSGHPLDWGHAVCIDTYAHGGGWLTCLETKTNSYWQTSQKKALRYDTLL